MAVHNVYVNTVNNFGNSKQKEEFLRPFADGENLGSFCLSEPGISIDQFNIYVLYVMVLPLCQINPKC